MTIKKITKEDSYNIDWLLQHKNHGLDTNGLSEVCKILIEKVNQLIDVTTNSLEQTEAGGQFLKTSQTKENQKSVEQLLSKHAVSISVCDEFENDFCLKCYPPFPECDECPHQPKEAN